MDSETRFLAAEGRTDRVIAARLRPGTDLIGGIAAVCHKHDIRQGYISCVIGSLRQAVYALPVPDASSASGIRYSDPIKVGGPIELIAGQGVICRSPEGELMIHFHAAFCDPDGKGLAGHFSTGGNPVLVTAEMIITEISGMCMFRRHDPEVGLMMLVPEA
ncbi:MAG: DNA-binding protein [Deltaproteobacteria bacterium]|nr:DNA-binding protein [Deltaproteobacteria bacterium]